MPDVLDDALVDDHGLVEAGHALASLPPVLQVVHPAANEQGLVEAGVRPSPIDTTTLLTSMKDGPPSERMALLSESLEKLQEEFKMTKMVRQQQRQTAV